MKSIIIFILILLYSCQPGQSRKEYFIEIKEEEPNLLSSGYSTKYSTDTIKAKDDADAYRQGFITFCIHAKTYKQVNLSKYLSKPVDFKVYNFQSIDIGKTLQDSLKKRIEKDALKFWENENNRDSIMALINSSDRVEYIRKELDDFLAKTLFDTAGLWSSPVKVISAKMVERDYSNYKDIQLLYQNISDKKIDAIRFQWYGTNSFNEPADMGGYTQEGFGGGFTDDPLVAGRKKYSTWSIMSKDGKKVVLAWPYEVAFSDGSKWSLKED